MKHRLELTHAKLVHRELAHDDRSRLNQFPHAPRIDLAIRGGDLAGVVIDRSQARRVPLQVVLILDRRGHTVQRTEGPIFLVPQRRRLGSPEDKIDFDVKPSDGVLARRVGIPSD